MKNPFTKHQTLITKHVFLVALFLVAFLERVAYDLGPNIELITMAMILSSFYFGKKESFWLTFAIIAATDRVIGNSNIFLFTWSGFLLPALFASSLINQSSNLQFLKLFLPKISNTVSLLSTGIAANLFFFLWTNFGVWLLDSWNMYPNTFGGLIQSYINALPFLRNQIASTLVFIPLGHFLIETVRHLENKRALSKCFPSILSPSSESLE